VWRTGSILNRAIKFDPAKKVLTAWGSDGTGEEPFYNSWGVAIDSQGNVFVADSGHNRIQKFRQP
jgi:DNA-binding beta-propeller fold protein YncE